MVTPARPFARRHRLAVVALLATATLSSAACGSGVQEASVDTGASPTFEEPAVSVPAPTTTTEAEETTTTEADVSTTTVAPADVPEAEEPGDLGDDPQLDALAQSCFEGDFGDCDQLFFDSPAESAYEAYGDSCGGRNEPSGLCVNLYGQG